MKLTMCRQLLILMLFYAGCSYGQTPVSVMIFTDKSHPVDTAGVTDISINYYQLDTIVQLTQHLNSNLKNLSKEQAEQAAKAYLTEHHGAFKKGLEGLIKAQQLKLTQYPAIVFEDGKAVIYGQTFLYQAVEEYRQWHAVSH